MLRFFLGSIFVFGLFIAQAQVGLSGHYLSGQAEQWQYTAGSSSQASIDLPGTGWRAGIDYWFRLKNARIEFLPTLAYSRQEQTITPDRLALDTRTQGYHFFFTTHIYFLDLAGDCDCPTWSKEGPTLQKGIFLQISPGVSYFDYAITDRATDTKTTFTANDTAFSLGLGLGFDLGLSDFLTLTPQLGIRYYPTAKWASLSGEPGLTFPLGVEAKSQLLQYNLGLRLGFRIDR
ncbi:MAG: hypothetical protein DA408_07365 [Bacteroidetes bacterium]|nr:MAG: hypothetical protein C7N36_19935 [Bacteroidota bacterium]PTM13318.1 MAG: hypothetical protein DA408_07365 [Bacteroidota bacterium]